MLALLLQLCFTSGLLAQDNYEIQVYATELTDIHHTMFELHSNYTIHGSIGNFDPLKQQRHQLFGVVDWNFNPDWEFNAGIGYGLTEGTDKWIAKLILGYRLPF